MTAQLTTKFTPEQQAKLDEVQALHDRLDEIQARYADSPSEHFDEFMEGEFDRSEARLNLLEEIASNFAHGRDLLLALEALDRSSIEGMKNCVPYPQEFPGRPLRSDHLESLRIAAVVGELSAPGFDIRGFTTKVLRLKSVAELGDAYVRNLERIEQASHLPPRGLNFDVSRIEEAREDRRTRLTDSGSLPPPRSVDDLETVTPDEIAKLWESEDAAHEARKKEALEALDTSEEE